jgi:hypothetical protein
VSAAGAPAAHRRLEPWLALCLCLPPALFTWPGASAPLAGDPFPHLAGSAWIALLALPALALAAAARALRPSAALLLLLVATAAGALSAALLPATDTAELRRAGVHAGAMIALFAAGSALGERGRTWLAGASVVLCLGFTAGAFFTSSGRLAGALANTGALSQAALPGAVAGALLALAPRVPRGARAIGAAAFAGFALHAARAPVLAGILAAGGALTAAGMLASAMLSRRARAACLGAALFLPLGFLALRVAPAAREGRGAERFAARRSGGVASRCSATTSSSGSARVRSKPPSPPTGMPRKSAAPRAGAASITRPRSTTCTAMRSRAWSSSGSWAASRGSRSLRSGCATPSARCGAASLRARCSARARSACARTRSCTPRSSSIRPRRPSARRSLEA